MLLSTTLVASLIWPPQWVFRTRTTPMLVVSGMIVSLFQMFVSSSLLIIHHIHVFSLPMFRARFPEQEYATELRQVQASKWAFRSVADGIDHFKAGRHTEAFQCLNKALSIDPRNIEGLVARGALYVENHSFKPLFLIVLKRFLY